MHLRLARHLSRLVLASAVASAVAIAMASAVRAETRAIADDAALRAAIAAGVAGDTLVLAPGRYGALSLHGARGEVPAVIRSADPANPAEIAGLTARGFDGLRLENLHLRYRFSPGDSIRFQPFAFSGCANLALVSSRIEGDEARGVGPTSDGLPYAFGLRIAGCRGVRLEGLHISRFFRGVVMRESQDIAVIGNEITALRMDGMNFAQVENVLIENNYIHSFRRSTDKRDHADMIQFWTNHTERPSRGITIRGNLLHSGDGLFTQSIFMRNDLVDRGRAGREMFYRDILIEENVIVNAHMHGITVGESDGLTIRRNTLVHNPLSTGPKPERELWRPVIRVSSRSVGVRIEGNLAARILGFEGQPGWRMGENLLIQDRSSMRPGWYGRVFMGQPGGDPRDLATLAYRPDGEAAAPHLGAARLRR